MWLARVGGFLAGLGVFISLAGWYRTDSADKAAYMVFLLTSLAAAIASAIARRKAGGPSPLATMLRWFGGVGIVTAVLGNMLVLSRGVAHQSDYARADLGQIEMAQSIFLLDSSRFARSVAELGDRYRSSSLPYQHSEGEPALRVTPDGYSAEVHLTRTLQTCVIYAGPTPVPPATEEGKAQCSTEALGGGSWIGGLTAAIGIAMGAAAVRRRATPPAPPAAA